MPRLTNFYGSLAPFGERVACPHRPRLDRPVVHDTMHPMEPRVVFMGTPEFALPILARLCEHYPVVGVVTQPDRPAGRGNRLTPPPVKTLALAEGLPVFQPEKVRRPEALAQIQAWEPEIIIVAAYGQILPPALLDMPRYGALNVHASLLPRWRGAAPIEAAILAGDTVTGVTLMQMEPGLDTGPILAKKEIYIGPEETAGELSERMAHVGADMLIETLPLYLAGELQPQPQPEAGVTLAPRLSDADARLDWQLPAEDLHRRVRAFAPAPGAWTTLPDGTRFKILRATLFPTGEALPAGQPGQVTSWRGFPVVYAGTGALILQQVQAAGKRPLNGDVFLRGQRALLGAVLGS